MKSTRAKKKKPTRRATAQQNAWKLLQAYETLDSMATRLSKTAVPARCPCGRTRADVTAIGTRQLANLGLAMNLVRRARKAVFHAH